MEAAPLGTDQIVALMRPPDRLHRQNSSGHSVLDPRATVNPTDNATFRQMSKR